MAEQTQFVDINGVLTAYQVAGAGPAVVFVHAGIADLRMWDDQFDIFAADYRVVRYDRRGAGQTPCPPGDYSLVEDLRALLDALAIDKATLVGCSMGGGLVIDFALTYPDRVTALVLVGAGLGGYESPKFDPEEERGDEVSAAYDQGDLDTAAEILTQVWYDGPPRTPDQTTNPAARDHAKLMIRHLLDLPEDEGQHQSIDPPAYSRLDAITAPTLVIVGAQDLSDISDIADVLANGIPSAQRVTMPDTAHLPNMEHPDDFNRLVLNFLQNR